MVKASVSTMRAQANGDTYDRYVRFHVDGPGISRLEADFVSRTEGSGNGDVRVINACIGLDADSDGVSDHLDDDMDNDGVKDTNKDNCPAISNSNQLDTDGDGIGDACDADDDADGVADAADNCPLVSNNDQADADTDGGGNVCDQDDDGDGITDVLDNCPLNANPQQSDADADGSGDACDVTDSPLVPIPVFHTSLAALWLMALFIGIMGGRGASAVSKRKL